MAYHIAVDSCTDMTAAMKKDEHITLVPLTLNVGEDKVIDDETFNQAEFLRKVAECPEHRHPHVRHRMRICRLMAITMRMLMPLHSHRN